MWSPRQKVRQETRNSQGEYAPYDAAPSNVTLSFEEGGLSSDEDFERLAEEYGVDVTGNDGESVEVHGRAQDIRALAYEAEQRHGAKPHIEVTASEDSDPAWSTDIDDYTDSEEVTASITPGDPEESQGEVRYSFVKEFEETEEQFNVTFDGYPNRFFSANLRGEIPKRRGRPRWGEDFADFNGSWISRNADLDSIIETAQNSDDPHRGLRHLDHIGVAERTMKAATDSKDNQMDSEQAEEMFSRLPGFVSAEPIEESTKKVLSTKAARAWKVTTEDDEGNRRVLAVTDGGDRELRHAAIRGHGGSLSGEDFMQTDLRMMAGSERINRATGHDIVTEMSKLRNHIPKDELADSKVGVLTAVRDLEEAQSDGRNFLAQKKYLRNQQSSIAGVFDDKKHPDKTRRKMMAETSLTSENGGPFTKVEIDNDVDPEEYADFEQAYHQIADKLPSSNGRPPELRIRKLGKHRANGLFSSGHNAVDVRTSEAFIHEMGHHFDLVANSNASLSSDFKDISRGYAGSLDEEDPKQREYYNTPTEQLARGFEVYAVERLGINNRLVNPSKFDRNDYAPYTQNPELKEKTFAFFDRLFDRN